MSATELCREPCDTTAEVEILHARSGTVGSISSITPVSSVGKFWLLDLIASRSVESEAEVEDVIVLRELNKEAAKKEVLELIEREPGIGFYDISLKLRLELGFVVEVCEELMSEGKLLAKEPIKI